MVVYFERSHESRMDIAPFVLDGSKHWRQWKSSQSWPIFTGLMITKDSDSPGMISSYKGCENSWFWRNLKEMRQILELKLRDPWSYSINGAPLWDHRLEQTMWNIFLELLTWKFSVITYISLVITNHKQLKETSQSMRFPKLLVK